MPNKGNDLNCPIFVKTSDKLPLLTGRGRSFLGLKNSFLPVLDIRAKALFEHLNKLLGFADTPKGMEYQECFNTLLCAIYPEMMIDLADLVYLQHERLSVLLNFDLINKNLQKEHGDFFEPETSGNPAVPTDPTVPLSGAASVHDRRRVTEPSGREMKAHPQLVSLNRKMDFLFQQLALTLRKDPLFYKDPEIIRLLSECYSYYVFETKNFPWQNPVEPKPRNLNQSLMDVATGLAGLRVIFNWPGNYPRLVLTDCMPFIFQCLTHYKTMLGKQNIEILDADFPGRAPQNLKFGLIMSNKFLHHLKRMERKEFLRWAWESLEPDGILEILDTDVELRILRQADDPEFKKKLTSGYLESLIEIEDDFCQTLISDIKQSGFKVTHLDSNEYKDETDAYSKYPGCNLSLKFQGLEIVAQKML